MMDGSKFGLYEADFSAVNRDNLKGTPNQTYIYKRTSNETHGQTFGKIRSFFSLGTSSTAPLRENRNWEAQIQLAPPAHCTCQYFMNYFGKHNEARARL